MPRRVGAGLAERAAGNPQVTLICGPARSEHELAEAIDRCDGIVLPYKRIPNSGAVIHALSRYRPVLAPRLGSLMEVQEEVGSEWLGLYDGELSAETPTHSWVISGCPGPDRPTWPPFRGTG